MRSEVIFIFFGFFLIISLFVALARFVKALRNYKSLFLKMEKLLKENNLKIASKNMTLSSLAEMCKMVGSEESDAILREAKVQEPVVKFRFRAFVFVSIAILFLLAIW